MTTRMSCSHELLDLPSVGFSWTGGKAGAGVRCFLCPPRRGTFGTSSKCTSCVSSNNDVSERFVGSSLRSVLAPTAPFFVPTMCSGFVSDSLNQIPVPRSVKFTAPHGCFCAPHWCSIAFACRQLVKNCPSTKLMTHEVRELSQSLVWSGVSLTINLQVAHPPLVQQVLHQHRELLQSS